MGGVTVRITETGRLNGRTELYIYGKISKPASGIPRFYYKSYVLWEDEKEVRLTYHFEIQGLSSFAPSWRFPKALGDKARWRDDVLFQKMAFSLGWWSL